MGLIIKGMLYKEDLDKIEWDVNSYNKKEFKYIDGMIDTPPDKDLFNCSIYLGQTNEEREAKIPKVEIIKLRTLEKHQSFFAQKKAYREATQSITKHQKP